MADAASTALNAAARVFKGITRVVVAQRTRESAAAVNTFRYGPQQVGIRIGRPGGEWGWIPIQAFMLDNDWRHPFFGNRKKWYSENVHNEPKMGMLTDASVAAGADPAVTTFADTYVAEKFK